MKTKETGWFLLVTVTGLLGVGGSLIAAPVGTAFTYQGRLKSAGAALNAAADFEFSLWDDPGTGSPPTGGTQIGATQSVESVSVVGGLFTVQLNAAGEFGPDALNGDARWLQIAVRSPAGAGAFATLSPRQPLTPTPYGLYALSAPWAGLVGVPVGFADGVDDIGDGSFWLPGTGGIYWDAGNVGIGTTAPAQKLTMVQSGAGPLAVAMEAGWSPPVTEYPSAAANLGDTGVAWSNPQLAVAQDEQGAQVTFTQTESQTLVVSGFGFALPSDAVILGIEVGIRKRASVGSVRDFEIGLAGGAGPSENKALGGTWFVLYRMDRYGGPSDTWGLTWTPEQINDPAFGVGVKAERVIPSVTAYIDVVTVSVTYAGPSASTSWSVGVDQRADFVVSADGALSTPVFQVTPGNDILFPRGGIGVTGASSPFPRGSGVFIEGGSNPQIFGFNYDTFSPQNLLLNATAGYNVGIGTTDPSQKLTVAGNICATGSIGACSDVRFKENVEPVKDALGKVSRLHGVEFDWRRDEYPDHRFSPARQVGLIAQEVRKVAPEVVQEGSDGHLSIDYGRLTPLLIEALRDLRAEKDAEIADLKDRVARLETLLEDRR